MENFEKPQDLNQEKTEITPEEKLLNLKQHMEQVVFFSQTSKDSRDGDKIEELQNKINILEKEISENTKSENMEIDDIDFDNVDISGVREMIRKDETLATVYEKVKLDSLQSREDSVKRKAVLKSMLDYLNTSNNKEVLEKFIDIISVNKK